MIHLHQTCSEHSSHVIAHPLCEKQTCCKKSFNVAFNALTCGIPYACYHYFPKCFPKTAKVLGEIFNSILCKIACLNPFNWCSTKNEYGISTVAVQDAGKKIRLETELHPMEPVLPCMKDSMDLYIQDNLIDEKGIPNNIQQLCKEFRLLSTLFYQELKFLKNLPNPWQHEELVNLSNRWMRCSYALTVFTLEDLDRYMAANPNNKNENGELITSRAMALVNQKSFHYRTILYFSQVYHRLRGGIVYEEVDAYDGESKIDSTRYPDPISQEHASLFYQKGTLFNEWNQLYNDACKRIRMYVTQQDLYNADRRYWSWTQEDKGVETFNEEPDQLPT